jgi:hypothetical protein
MMVLYSGKIKQTGSNNHDKRLDWVSKKAIRKQQKSRSVFLFGFFVAILPFRGDSQK